MIVRIKIAAMWSGVTSAWFVEPKGRRTALMVDGIVTDRHRAILANRGDVVEAELVPEHADSYQHATDRHAYLVVGEIVAPEDFGGDDFG